MDRTFMKIAQNDIEREVFQLMLSKRENAILVLLSEGLSQKMAASHFSISENTVKTYLRRAYKKLGAHSITEAIYLLQKKNSAYHLSPKMITKKNKYNKNSSDYCHLFG